MADSKTSGEDEQQITFNVKSSSDAKYVITVPTAITVADLKQKLSTEEYANTPPERQRLIYSGRVLKDSDTVGSCKIKDGNTVHLVRSAESNQRQAPSNQGGSTVPPGAGQSASNVPSNIAAGTGAGNPLAQLTGARYAGFHGLPGADMFGADGGMGAPPNADHMLRMLDDPNFAQQMNEAMNNPAVLDMLRNNPMIRNNPMARAAIENPEMRRMMLNPEMIRMQMQMQRAMGADPAGGGEGAFPMPGQTDTTPSGEGNATGDAGGDAAAAGSLPGRQAANPFAALFGGLAQGATTTGNPPPAAGTGSGGGSGGAGGPFMNGASPTPAEMRREIMMLEAQLSRRNPRANAASAEATAAAVEAAAALGGAGGFNPFAFGDFGGSPQAQEPTDSRPPEERYEAELRQLNDMGFFEFDRNVQALRRSGGNVQGAIEYLLTNP